MNLTTASELSSTTYAICSSIDLLLQAISSIPEHPYDQFKEILFGKEYDFPTICDIRVPETLDTSTIIKGLEQTYETHQERILDYLSAPDNFSIEQAGNQLTALAELSTNNTYVVTPEKYQEYVKTLETLQSINIRDVNATNCHDIIKKIGYIVLQTFQKKTIKV
jgi:hypothetical protein